MEQKHQPNPSVDRINRKAILTKRIRSIKERLEDGHKIIGAKRGQLQKKLADYQTEVKNA